MAELIPSVRIAASAIALYFVLSHSVWAMTDEEYARQCAHAQTLCKAGDPKCVNWRASFTYRGSVCPGVNALPGASMKGPPTQTSASAPTNSVHQAIVDDNKYPESAQSETLDNVRESCSARWGWHRLVDQTQCMKRVMARSRNPTDPYINLYILEADKLSDDVQHKRTSEAAAILELQKTYLDVLARQSAARESAARIGALERQQEIDRQQLSAEANTKAQAAEQAKRDAAQLAEEIESRQAQRRHDEAAEFCVAETNSRLSANPGFLNSRLYLGIYPTSFGASTFTRVDSLCAENPYWYKNVPAPPVQINCQRNFGGVNCSSQ